MPLGAGRSARSVLGGSVVTEPWAGTGVGTGGGGSCLPGEHSMATPRLSREGRPGGVGRRRRPNRRCSERRCRNHRGRKRRCRNRRERRTHRERRTRRVRGIRRERRTRLKWRTRREGRIHQERTIGRARRPERGTFRERGTRRAVRTYEGRARGPRPATPSTQRTAVPAPLVEAAVQWSPIRPISRTNRAPRCQDARYSGAPSVVRRIPTVKRAVPDGEIAAPKKCPCSRYMWLCARPCALCGPDRERFHGRVGRPVASTSGNGKRRRARGLRCHNPRGQRTGPGGVRTPPGLSLLRGICRVYVPSRTCIRRTAYQLRHVPATLA